MTKRKSRKGQTTIYKTKDRRNNHKRVLFHKMNYNSVEFGSEDAFFNTLSTSRCEHTEMCPFTFRSFHILLNRCLLSASDFDPPDVTLRSLSARPYYHIISPFYQPFVHDMLLIMLSLFYFVICRISLCSPS
jgi:hypothetical protein